MGTKMNRYFSILLILLIIVSGVINASKDTSYPFISYIIFSDFCGVPNLAQMHPGDAIYNCNMSINNFFSHIHPKIRVPYILISHGGWPSMPGQYAKYLNDPKLIAWFAKNGDSSIHEKMFCLPIGIGSKANYPTDFHGFLKKIITQVTPPEKRSTDKLLYINHTSHTHPDRPKIMEAFKDKEFCYIGTRKSNEDFIKELAKFRFVASPHGLGPDCHRTWEALYVKTIPIIKRSHICELFDNLPVLIVDNWNEITREFLEVKFNEIMSKSYNFEKIIRRLLAK